MPMTPATATVANQAAARPGQALPAAAGPAWLSTALPGPGC